MSSISEELATRSQSIISNQHTTDLEALRLAFNSAVKDGLLVDYYEYAFAKGSKSQLFVYSIINGVKNNTLVCNCFKAERLQSNMDILISEYDELYSKVVANLEKRADVPDTMKKKIIASLNTEFMRISKVYINQLRERIVAKARRLKIDRTDKDQYFDFCYNIYCKIVEMFRHLHLKNFQAVTGLSGNKFWCEFYILDNPMMIVHKYTRGENSCWYTESTEFIEKLPCDDSKNF